MKTQSKDFNRGLAAKIAMVCPCAAMLCLALSIPIWITAMLLIVSSGAAYTLLEDIENG